MAIPLFVLPDLVQADGALNQLMEQARSVDFRAAAIPSPILVAEPGRSYALGELDQLKNGPDADSARRFLYNLKQIGWPVRLFERLKESGVRIAFYAPDARSEQQRYAAYDFPSKTIFLWTNRGDVIAAELAHAVSDLLEPDDPRACTGMMSLQSAELAEIWKGYIAKINRYLGVGSADREILLYPREYLNYMMRREISSPHYWLGKDPMLGQKGYLSREAFWEEGVVWYFMQRGSLRSREHALFAFVDKTLKEAELLGFKERVANAPDMRGCFEGSAESRSKFPIAF